MDKSLFKPIQNKRTFEKISTKIKKLIFQGSLKPGDKLPSEVELARRYGVGRQTVREALRVLEISGFISVQQGGAGGPIVKDTVLNTISNSFVDAIRMKKITMEEVTAVRIELEKFVVRCAVESADENDLEAMQANIVAARKKINTQSHARMENFDFHILLAQSTKNEVLVIIMKSIMALLAVFLSRYQLNFEMQKYIIEQHQAVLDFIVKRRAYEACMCLEKYLLEIQSWYKDEPDLSYEFNGLPSAEF